MNKFKHYIFMAAGFTVLAAVVSGITAGPAIAALVKAALIKNVDEQGRIPYSIQVSCDGLVNSCTAQGPVVPANSRLVIENVSGVVSASGGNLQFAALTINGTYSFHSKVMPLKPVLITAGNWIMNEVGVFYVEAGDKPTINVLCDSSVTLLNSGFTISGYLVDLTI